jgi:hypothetical protein
MSRAARIDQTDQAGPCLGVVLGPMGGVGEQVGGPQVGAENLVVDVSRDDPRSSRALRTARMNGSGPLWPRRCPVWLLEVGRATLACAVTPAANWLGVGGRPRRCPMPYARLAAGAG